MRQLVLAALGAAFLLAGPAQASWIKPPTLFGPAIEKKAPAKKKRTALIRSGLLDDSGSLTKPVEDALRKQGYTVTRKTWWASDSGRYTVAIGHSKGADRVLSDNARTIIAIDPTFVNPGCPSAKSCTAYVGHLNKFPFLICCGGYEVRGAKNIAISPGHLSAPRIALSQILKQTARL